MTGDDDDDAGPHHELDPHVLCDGVREFLIAFKTYVCEGD